jgi:2-desacetyl-2-hydroxyethyl bacteriochlorophyllide A dehydrogenase
MHTHAVMFTAPGQVEYRQVALPEPRRLDVLVRTRYSAISPGTDGWVLKNQFSWQPTEYPAVPGYQRVGIVEHSGRRVVATFSTWDNPLNSQWGAHAARAMTVSSELYDVDDRVSDIAASHLVVAQVGYNAASRIVGDPGARVLVIGDGLIGQFAAQCALARGFDVTLVGRRQYRLDLSRQVGVAKTILLDRAEPRIESDEAQAVIDTVQGVDAQNLYLHLLPRGSGQIVYSGFTPGESFADMARLQQAEITAHFVSGWTRPRMLATLGWMAEGKLKVEPLVTHIFPAHRAAEAYAAIESRSLPTLGVVLDWTEYTEQP